MKPYQYIVRLYDRFDRYWTDVSSPVSSGEADRLWNEYTKNGTEHTRYEDGSYYEIFPADTEMLFSADRLAKGRIGDGE